MILSFLIQSHPLQVIRHLFYPQLHHLQILNIPLHQRKADDGLHFVKALLPCRPRVDVQQAVLFVGHHLEDVGMAADEQPGRLLPDDLPHAFAVTAGIAADVGHQDVDALAFKAEVFRESPAHRRIVDVAVYGAQGAESFQLVCYLTGADIAGVPDFVAFFKVLKDAFVQVGVGVGEEADSFHGCCG